MLLKERDLEKIITWGISKRNSLGILCTILYDPDAILRWRAIEAIGRLSAVISRENIERVRRQIRRLFWMMNDESGSICWYAPEAIGEILYNVPELIGEYGNILLSFLDEEPFEGGVRWAISRICERSKLSRELNIEFQNLKDDVIRSLDNDNPKIRGNALLALIKLNQILYREQLDVLLKDKATIEVYDFSSGELDNRSIYDLAQSLIYKT